MLKKNWEDWLEWGNNPRKRRDRLYIMAEILNVAKDGVLKTQIMYRANLSFAQLNNYLSLLTDLKLLNENSSDRKTMYKTTKKGAKFMENYKDIVLLLKNNSDDCPKSPKTSTW